MTISVTSCASLEKQLDTAARTQGKIQAGIDIGEQPPECKRQEAHAPLVKGKSPVIILKQERRVVNRLNNRIQFCSEYHSTLRENMLNPSLK